MKQKVFRLAFILFFIILFFVILLYPAGGVESSSFDLHVNTAGSVESHKKVHVRKASKEESRYADSSDIKSLDLIEPVDVHAVFEEPVEEAVESSENEVELENLEGSEEFDNSENSVEVAVDVTGSQSEKVYDLNSDSSGLIEGPEIDLAGVYRKIIYPQSMRRHNIEASFDVRVFVDSEGDISLSFVDGVEPLFKNAVTSAFKGVKAKPATISGRPVSVVFTIPIVFSLK